MMRYLFVCVCGYATGGTLATCPRCKRSLEQSTNDHDNGFGGG